MPIEALEFVILVLAAYRITRFFVKDSLIGMAPDSGTPMSVRVDRFAYFDNGEDRTWLRGKIGDLLTCTWCTGWWVSLAVTALWLELAPWLLGVHGWVLVFAVAGAQGFINSRMNA